jgi:hypothetical protein
VNPITLLTQKIGQTPTIIGVFLTTITLVPLVGSTAVGAISGPAKEATAHLTLTAHATLACGPFTFAWGGGNDVTYFQIHATDVSCAVAKTVVAKGGKWHGVPPAGWTVGGEVVHEDGVWCAYIWKHGAARVIGYLNGC